MEAPPVGDVAIIVPVLDRPHRVAPLIDSIEGATRLPHRLLFVVSDNDRAERAALEAAGADHLVVGRRQVSYPAKINAGYRATTEPWLFLAADDIAPRDGWLDAALALAGDGVHVIGTNDLGNRRVLAGEHSTHTLVRRSYCDHPGATADCAATVLWEGYRHWYVDDELVGVARHRNVYAHAHDAIVEHLHPYWGKGEEDRTYRLGEQRRREDRRRFARRRNLWGAA